MTEPPGEQDILNWIDGERQPSGSHERLDKVNPHTGDVMYRLVNSSPDDVQAAVASSARAQHSWSAITPVLRGQVLRQVVDVLRSRTAELARAVSEETGKPPRDAEVEVQAALLQGEYFAGEGMRLHGRSLTSAVPGKYSHTVRQPRGVCGLIVPANTPVANIAWKVFPALICGNTAVLKASDDAPRVAQVFVEATRDAGLPKGVLNVLQGDGRAGAALVDDVRVAVISFTGSTAVGRRIAEVAGKRLARVSLELGGKNPFVVCDDADIANAVHWATLSAFSNAGQRCAAGSRILVFEAVYEAFRNAMVAAARALRLGVDPGCDLGPVLHRRQQEAILAAIDRARSEGGRILCGGRAPADASLARGCYVEPTIVEGLSPDSELECREVFGPVCTLRPVQDIHEALRLANGTEYGLTAAIHTRDVDRAIWFAQHVRAGVANVNFGTFGSEPHMPFGGFGASGNGTREPGAEALDVYSEIKNISFFVRERGF